MAYKKKPKKYFNCQFCEKELPENRRPDRKFCDWFCKSKDPIYKKTRADAALKRWYDNPEVREKSRIRQLNPKVKGQKAESRRRAFLKNPALFLFRYARHRAKERGIVFSITPEDVVYSPICPCCGIHLQHNFGCAKPDSPSLDKIDNTKGYIKDNIWVVCYRCNAIKSNSTPDELRKIADAVEKELSGKN